MRVCEVEGCERKHYAKGLCEPHYQRRKKGQSLIEKSVYEQSPEEKFRAKFTVATTGCWEWNFPNKTYNHPRAGTFMLNGKVMIAYRASYLLFKGRIPKGKLVCHTCDNGLCVNPDHLWLGTHADNTLDAVAKGRHRAPKGEAHSGAKLTEEQVAVIKAEYAPRKVSIRALASRFGVSYSTVHDIILGKTWK